MKVLEELAHYLGVSNFNSITIFNINSGKNKSAKSAIVDAVSSVASVDTVTISGAADPDGSSKSKLSNSEYNNLKASIDKGNKIAGLTVFSSTLTVVGGSIGYSDIDWALILGISIPIAVLLIAGIALFIYCKKQKEYNGFEDKFHDDNSGLTVR